MVFITMLDSYICLELTVLIFVITSDLSAVKAAVVLERSAYFFSLQKSSSQSSQHHGLLRQFLIIW